MAEKKRNTAAHLPLTPAELNLLLALADGDKHGYAVIKEVAHRSENKVRLSAGTLYGLIRRMVSEGMIVETDERPVAALDDERRRYYRLTEFGRRVAVAEAQRLEGVVELARTKRLLVRPRTA